MSYPRAAAESQEVARGQNVENVGHDIVADFDLPTTAPVPTTASTAATVPSHAEWTPFVNLSTFIKAAGIMVTTLTLLSLAVVCGAAAGVILTLVGQQVLLATHGESWAVAPYIVARIGAVGGVLASLASLAILLPVGVLFKSHLTTKDRSITSDMVRSLVPSLCFGAAAGAFAVDQASVAGLVGSAVLSGGSLALTLVFKCFRLLCLG
ncbi:hypothetical protein BD626DRAFT_518589, partial [Schizophyllum amplum]